MKEKELFFKFLEFLLYEGFFKSFASLIRTLQKIYKLTSNQKNFILQVITFISFPINFESESVVRHGAI